MRVVFIGASDLTLETAALLIKRRHEVIIVEAERDKIDDLKDDMDCSFLHGDGSRPHILKEADPDNTDFLFCLTQNDQYNIIAALIGRSLGFSKVILQIHDADYMHICSELDLHNVINPSQTISRYLADMVAGIDILELSSLIKGEARCFMIEVDDETSGGIEALDLPEESRVICIYRDDELLFPGSGTRLQVDDEVIILTHSKHLEELVDRYEPKQQGDKD
ncbi:MAG: TrkA family potassium uptake protein [Desulfuromonadales bacterium]|nr:TrkA family potassium uptake protein [Desulfuromonadales bacterium]NIS43027.1 TrkA family potassium uptake protein [Desulfuromonadales bacterium]